MMVDGWQLAALHTCYSDFKLLAGLARAARKDLYPTVSHAIVTDITTARIKSRGRIGMR